VLERFAAAVVWDEALAGLAGELVSSGVAHPAAPLPDVAAGTRRALALADLDAVHAVLLGLGRDDLQHVLSTFTALRTREERLVGRFVTADRVLAAYDRLTSA
jgi:hypothetical protein